MTKHIDSKKIEILKQIASLDSPKAIEAIENYIKRIQFGEKHKNIFRDTKQSISVEELKMEQDYSPINREDLDELVRELNIEESIEELLLMLNE